MVRTAVLSIAWVIRLRLGEIAGSGREATVSGSFRPNAGVACRMEPTNVDILRERHRGSGDPYLEFLREPSMSAGLYRIPAGEPDRQTPHAEDEVYVVTAGRGRIEIDGETYPIERGDVVFVERGVEHRFLDVEEDLETLVIFVPPEGSLDATG
jgi:mannose-6-phosphate isomerase-like protein (cupin superfamily)